MAYASTEIIGVLNKIKYPYNINILTQEQALKAVQKAEEVTNWVKILLKERTVLIDALKQLSIVQHIYPSDSNFVLVKVNDANSTYNYLVNKGIIIRNRSSVSLCLGCLRITVGTPEENRILIKTLKEI
jgi:histidinol-phosphate aminotransferase